MDGDIVAYKFSTAGEERIDWGEGTESVETNESKACSNTVEWIEHLEKELGANSHIICLSDPTRRYWRHDVYPKYKSHRSQGHRPVLVDVIKKFLVDHMKGKIVPTLEADDVLGILATHPTRVKGEKVIVTADKDLKQIPGLYYNVLKHGLGIQTISREDADRFFYFQTLTGDACDGFPGCPGIGPVRANKALDAVLYETGEEKFLWNAVVSVFLRKGLTEADALVQARVARICRWMDYDYGKKEVKLWSPN